MQRMNATIYGNLLDLLPQMQEGIKQLNNLTMPELTRIKEEIQDVRKEIEDVKNEIQKC